MEKYDYEGKYLSDIFLIDLPPHVAIFSKLNKTVLSSMEDFATYIHEYWHYLLNMSTIVRYRDFSTWFSLISIFTKSLIEGGDGLSDGSSNLTSDDKKRLEEYWELKNAFSSSYFENIQGKIILDLIFTKQPIIEDYKLFLNKVKVPLKKVSYPVSVKTEIGIEEGFYILGNRAIEESITNSIENYFIPTPKNETPINPYLILEKLSFFYCGKTLSNYELAAIGILSFLTTDPATSIGNIFMDYVSLGDSVQPKHKLQLLFNNIKNPYEKALNILLQDMQSIETCYSNRIPMNHALKYLREKFERFLKLRLENPFFDLEPFDINNSHNLILLNKLFYHIALPCDVLQRFEGDDDDIGRDILISFDNQSIMVDKYNISRAYLMQVLHCQLDYFKAHWAIFTIMKSDIANSKCPYYTTCDVAFRKNNSLLCKNTPWKNIKFKDLNCVYGIAVTCLLGETKFI